MSGPLPYPTLVLVISGQAAVDLVEIEGPCRGRAQRAKEVTSVPDNRDDIIVVTAADIFGPTEVTSS
jgi:hypothetical protein